MGQERAGPLSGASSGKLEPPCLLWEAQSAAEAGEQQLGKAAPGWESSQRAL